MRVESIEIRNFRQFKELSLKFPCVDGKSDLHIIFAKNGVGKTNVLNAITWCLYNSEMHLGDKSNASPILNNQRVQEIREHLTDGESQIGETSVCVTFSSDDSSEKIQFKRTGKFNVTVDAVIKLMDPLTVLHYSNGEWNAYDTEEDTSAFVKRTVPEEIHDYIFFDGEHLESYFKAGQFENIKNGIEELTQAKIIEKAENGFHKYLTEVLNPKIAKSSSKDISLAQQNINKIQNAIDDADANISEYSSQIHQCDDLIAELEHTISGHENADEKAKRLKTVEDSIDNIKKEINKNMADLCVFAREYTQYFALYKQIKNLYTYIKTQDNNGKLPPRIDKFLLDAIEKHKHCLICDQDLGEHSYSFIEGLKRELEVSSETSALLNKTIVVLRQYLAKILGYKSKRDELLKNKTDLEAKLANLEKEEQQLNNYLMNIPNSEAITTAIMQKKEYRISRDNIVKKKGIEEQHKKGLEEQYCEQSKLLKSLLEKNKQLEEVNLQAEYCKKCRNILRETRLELLDESRKEMELETFNTFSNLLWKKDAFMKVEILEDYKFRLLDNYGNQTLGSCSAAERALLALSFTLALQKVSMHDSLLFIDTPIGRVDEDNRINFIKTLCDISKKKQVILTFTPTEYDNNVSSALIDKYSSFNELDIKDGQTVILK